MCTHIVMAGKPSDYRFHMRTRPSFKQDALIAAALKGMKLSSMVKTLLQEVIRVEKAREPLAFAEPRRSEFLRAAGDDENGEDGGDRQEAPPPPGRIPAKRRVVRRKKKEREDKAS